MADSHTTSWGFGAVFFWGFIVIKVSGHLFTAWSWWWVFLPIIPFIGEAVRYYGL